MLTRTQQVTRTLACFYLIIAAVGVIVPMGTHIGTFKWRIGHLLTGGTIPISAHQLSGDQVTIIGDHALNVVMLLPLTLLATLGWPQVRWWVWGMTATIIGICSESAQFVFPELGRRPLVSNAIENAVGGWVGAGIAAYLHHLKQNLIKHSQENR
ncbi:VanZ domain-containing protein [Cutibacterium sp. WCA-380-WT-3A]|uniref:VanZ domain-containing protein n=1 Tax=Cutibacterium porci TaxID=2605781 RepID=A0A7K0J4J5_9ACTN|nr:VanZ family protein [Cutibacterium porci]MSS44860.1 VanZ domain-containing protein [Cutibacterium porci]